MGRRIAQARGSAGLTQEELAKAVGIDRSALAKIENGTRRVSALELARIANTVGERIEWFVIEAPPAVVSHRNLSAPGTASPLIDRILERAAWNTEFILSHDDRLDLTSPATQPKPHTLNDAEEAAALARRTLGFDTTEPAFNLSSRFSDAGLLPFALDLGPDAADAAVMHLRQGGVAVVNGHLQVGRRRLAAVHELGHYLFAEDYSVDWQIGERDDDDMWEARVDRFARAFLLPSAGIQHHWNLLRPQHDLRTAAVKAASRFRVDMSTLARRLFELCLVSQGTAQQIRQFRTTRADIVELNLLVHDELAAPHLARAYEEAVVRLYRQETISISRATDLLFGTWNEDDFPGLPNLPESAVRNLV
ncbi:Zn-dependent peptidase ImmA (M78 family) [Micromonospora sp. Llam0]|nr:Zn-dependent peptidase ImmA (M78 family) [Micromonospora sp. Llam0]